MIRLKSLLLCCAALSAFALASQAARADEFDKYVPEGTNFYLNINLKQMCGSSMLRKALPKLLDKYGENVIKMAAAANPQAAALEGMWPQIQEAIRDQEKVDQFFDLAADNVDSFIMAGKFSGGEPQDAVNFVMLFNSKHMTAQNVEMVAGLAGGQIPGGLKQEKMAGKDVWSFSPPGAPMSIYIALPAEGCLAMSGSKEMMEKCLKGGGKEAGFAASIKPYMKNRTDKCSIFFVGEDKKDDHLGWGQIMFGKDLDVNVNVECKDAEKAKAKAAEMNEEFSSAVARAETQLGDAAEKLKGLFETAKKAKAKAEGKTVVMKLNLTTDAVMKAIKD